MDQTHHPLRLSLDFDIGAESGYQKVYKKKSNKRNESDTFLHRQARAMHIHHLKQRSESLFVPAIKDQMVFVVKQPYKLPVESCHICTGRQSITPDILALSSTPNTSHSQLRHQIIYVLLTV
eukprot:277885_1